MLNPKTHLAPLPCGQRDIDICSALMGKPIGKTKLEDVQAEAVAAAPPQIEEHPSHIDLTNLMMLPTNKAAMREWVKHVQSTVVQVSENVKHKVVDAKGQMRTRMVVVGDQMKTRLAESATQAAKRMRKAG